MNDFLGCSLTEKKVIKSSFKNSPYKSIHTTSFLSSSEQAEEPTTVNKSSEKSVGSRQKYEFQAETKELLNIVAKSLYSEKEVFVRELISNASDALEKLKYEQLTSNVADNEIPYEISIDANDVINTLTIQDTGLGMNKEEIMKYLGTIAHSGSKAFINNLKADGTKQTNNVIGQFGVGFYSAFMVADRVQVFTQSHKEGEKAYEWNSTGLIEYFICLKVNKCLINIFIL